MAAHSDTKAALLMSLFGDLDKFSKNQDYEKVVKVSNKILNENADEPLAFHCKVVALVQLGKFEEVLSSMKRFNKLVSHVLFEKAYCEYRLNRTKEALQTLGLIENKELKEQELLAQVLYRIEDYDAAFKVFRDLVKNSEDDFEDEREANMAAVIASMSQGTDGDMEDVDIREDTYELCYNSACHLIGRGMLKEAAEKLRKAEELCKVTFEDEPDMTPEEVEAELAIIRVQLGYVLQMMGKNDEAMKLYSLVTKQKPSDAALNAVACNNIITINKDQNLFDSKKKMKVATSDGLQQKLTRHQRQVISMNQCLLQMYSNQSDLCNKNVVNLTRTYENDQTPYLIQAASLSRDKQPQKAIDYLKNHVTKNPDCGIDVKLTLAQLYLQHGNVYPACDVIKSMGDISHKPGLVATLVKLYMSQEDKESASQALIDAVNFYKKKQPSSGDLLTLVRANAHFQYKYGKPEQAVAMLEELRKRDPRDSRILAQLISAYSKFDPAKAHAISKDLPSVADMAHEVDISALEASLNSFSNRYVKKSGKADPSPKSPKSEGTDELLVKRKRKKNKKKSKPPQNPDAPVDPERWLPRRERSYYRGKRKDKRKDIGKGTQGAASASGDGTDASKTTSPPPSEIGSPRPGSSGTAPQAAPQGPRQQKPQAGSKKKKKKGNKW